MMKHEKSNNEKKIEIPDNQIVYDQRKVINQTIAIRRKRSLENKRRVAISKCINIVSFLLIAAAVLFLLPSFADKRIWSDKPEENFPKSAKTL